MFNSKEDALKEEVKELTATIEELNAEIRNKDVDIAQERRERESYEKIKYNEIKMEISKATLVKETENNKLLQEIAVVKKENEILTKAFENMGFDVKDMKSILDKLVEGIIGKNIVNVIK